LTFFNFSNIRPGVLDLTGGFEDGRDRLVANVGQLKELIIGELLGGKSVLDGVAGIGDLVIIIQNHDLYVFEREFDFISN